MIRDRRPSGVERCNIAVEHVCGGWLDAADRNLHCSKGVGDISLSVAVQVAVWDEYRPDRMAFSHHVREGIGGKRSLRRSVDEYVHHIIAGARREGERLACAVGNRYIA